ncbi:MAG TPA: metallophosphoesterase [Anaerolineae bacterium]|nr:metallophosphoesterase [Anaerolineae bacterium]
MTFPASPPLRILAVSDATARILYQPRVQAVVGPVDLLLSCGDLPYSYLDFLVTALNPPAAFYVHGNHDVREEGREGVLAEPAGLQNLDRRTACLRHSGLLLAGLEGCVRYLPQASYQATQQEMALRVARLTLRLTWNRLRYGRYLDILITHAPPAGIHDGPDPAHLGFKALLPLMRRCRPRLLLHGHKHIYGPQAWHTRYAATDVVNVYPFRLIEWRADGIAFGRLSQF